MKYFSNVKIGVASTTRSAAATAAFRLPAVWATTPKALARRRVAGRWL